MGDFEREKEIRRHVLSILPLYLPSNYNIKWISLATFPPLPSFLLSFSFKLIGREHYSLAQNLILKSCSLSQGIKTSEESVTLCP